MGEHMGLILVLLAVAVGGGFLLARAMTPANQSAVGTLTRSQTVYENDEKWSFRKEEDGSYSATVHREANID